MQACLIAVEQLLDHHLRRALHVIVYASSADARAALGRAVSPSALLAPLHEPERAIVVMQSPAADPRNGDERRMRRHICHELAHVFACEQTGSVKRLGDGDTGIRMAAWVNEGFAECVAAHAGGRPEIIDAALASSARMDDDALHAAFTDLDSADRAGAFAVATARVWRAVQALGFGHVFRSLGTPERWSIPALS